MMEPVDWRKVINDLVRAGMDQTQQAKELCTCRRTIVNWREGITEPRYSHGAKLIEIYRSVIGST